MAQQVAVVDGATGGAYVAIVYSEKSCKGDVFDHEMHMNTLECSFVVHRQLQSHSTDQNEYSAMSCIPYVMYIRMCALSQWLYIQPYMSGLYTVVLQWLLGVQYYCMGMVFGLSQSECVGWCRR